MLRRLLAIIIPLLLISPVASSSLPSATRLGEGWVELTLEEPVEVSLGEVISSKRYVLASGQAEVSVVVFAFGDDQQASLNARPIAEQVLGGMGLKPGLAAEYLVRDFEGNTGGRVYALGPRLYVAVWRGEDGMRAEEEIASCVRELWAPGLLDTLQNLWRTVLRQVSEPRGAEYSTEPRVHPGDRGLPDTIAGLWVTVNERYRLPEVEELYLSSQGRHKGLREVCQTLETGGVMRAEVAVGTGDKAPVYVIRGFCGEVEISGSGGRFYPLEDRAYVFSRALVPRLTERYRGFREDASVYWVDVDRYLYEEVLRWEFRREDAFRSQMGPWRFALLQWGPSLFTGSIPARVIKGGHELVGGPAVVTSLSACYAVYRDAREGSADHSLAMDMLRGHRWGIGDPYAQALRLLDYEGSGGEQEIQRILFNAYLKQTAVGVSL